MPDGMPAINLRPKFKKGTLHQSMSHWVGDKRIEKAREASLAAREFEDACVEIRERVLREGPWATAKRLAEKSFINGSQA